MRVGDIVATPEDVICRLENIITSLETQAEPIYFADNRCWEFDELTTITVRDLFGSAGFPVPEGAKLSIGTYHCGHSEFWAYCLNGKWFDFTCMLEQNELQWNKTVEPENDKLADLSRLPAADAWDCLPEVVKAVVR